MRRGRAVVGENGERGAVEEMGEEAAAEGRRAAGGKRAAGERGERAAPRGKTGMGEREVRAVIRGTAAPLQENKS